MKSFLSRLILKFWPLILVVTLLLSALSLPPTIGLFKKLSTDPADLLPEDHPNVKTLLQARKKLEKNSRVYFIFESDDPVATELFLNDTAEKLKNHPLVGLVGIKKESYSFFEKHKLLYASLQDLVDARDRLERRIQKEKLGGLYVDFTEGDEKFSLDNLRQKYAGKTSGGSDSPYYRSVDGRIYSIYAEMKNKSSGLKEASQFHDAMTDFYHSLRPIDFHPSMQAYFNGASKVIEYHSLVDDLKRVGMISGIFLFVPLLFRFRNPMHVAVIFFPLLLGIPISLAASSFFVPKLTISTSFLFAILGGLGIESGIHVFTRYYEKKREGASMPQILEEIYGPVGRAILTAVASVAFTFLLLIPVDFRGFSEFGLIAGLGLWVLFIIYFTFFPSLLIFLEKIKVLKVSENFSDKDFGFNIPKRVFPVLLTVFILLSVLSLALTPKLGFEFDSKKIRADIPSVKLAREKQRQTTYAVNSPAVIVLPNREEANHLKGAVEERRASNPETTIEGVRTYDDLVPNDQSQKMAVLAQVRTLLNDPAIRLLKGEKKEDIEKLKSMIDSTTTFTDDEVPKELKYAFMGKADVPGELVLINAFPRLELDNGRNAMHFADDVGHFKTEKGDYYPASDAVVYGMVLKTMLKDAKFVVLISLLSVGFFVFLDFRNLRKTSIIMLSIVLGVLWLLGLMVVFDINFNFYNMIIIPAVMGMSIDNSIHIFHRYQELGHGSIPEVLSSTGVAAMLASLTNASGFLGLLFCMHQGLYSIGLLAVIGVATCFVSTLVFLPVLLQFLENRKKIMV